MKGERVHLYTLPECGAYEKAYALLLDKGYTVVQHEINNPLLGIGAKLVLGGNFYKPIVCIPNNGIFKIVEKDLIKLFDFTKESM